MPTTIDLKIGGKPATDDLYDAIELLEVEENADRPDALLLRLPVNRTAKGDLEFVGDGMFEPNTTITLVVTPPKQAAQCIFDGYVLAWRLHLDPSGEGSTIDVWAHDASWLMSRDETVKEWTGMSDGQVANAIFTNHGFTPATGNTKDDPVKHQPEQHSLVQRGSDLQFLRGLARRNGKLCRVACADKPGARTGYFVTPAVDGRPAATISLAHEETWTVESLEFDWDVMRPTVVQASQVPLDSSSASVQGDASATGLAPLDARDYPTYAGQPSTLRLTATADAAELPVRAKATLRDAGWFVRCRGETDIDRLGASLRVGSIVAIEGAGNLLSGKWFAWSVRHRVDVDAITLQFTLVRNAIGAAGGGGGLGLPGGVL